MLSRRVDGFMEALEVALQLAKKALVDLVASICRGWCRVSVLKKSKKFGLW